MKHLFKSILKIMMTVFMIITLLPGMHKTIEADDWWSLNNGTLTINCNGAMTDYTYYVGNTSYSDSPWYEYKDSITSIVFGNNVTGIGTYAFIDCSNLTSVAIPATVNSIGENAFQNCGLTSLTINNGVETIGKMAFGKCASLTSVTIPASVTSIGDSAFDYTGLTTVTFNGNTPPTTIGNYAFGLSTNSLQINVPEGKTADYKQALGDYYNANVVVPVTGVSLSPNTTQTIGVGANVSFTASVSPNDANDGTVKWSVSNSNVKLYSDSSCQAKYEIGTGAVSDLTVYAKGISIGTTTVTVTSNADDSKTASCNVTVGHTVTFDPANGSSTFTQIVANNGYATKPTTEPINDQWDFYGWYQTPVIVGGDQFTFNTTKITNNITLKAVWESTFSVAANDINMGKVGWAKKGTNPTATTSSGGLTIFENYESGDWYDVYSFTAEPYANYRFVKWIDEDGDVSTDQTIEYKCTAKGKLTAVFDKKITLDLAVTEGGVVTVSECKNTVSEGNVINKIGEVIGKGYGNFTTKGNSFKLNAIPKKDYQFVAFYKGKMVDGQVERDINEANYIDEMSVNNSSIYTCSEAVFEKYFYPTEGNNQKWTKGSGLPLSFTFECINDQFLFEGIRMDDGNIYNNEELDDIRNTLINKKNYDVDDKKNNDVDNKKRSDIDEKTIIINLKPEYLEKLSAGEHTLNVAIVIPEGIPMMADAKFTIIDNSSGSSSSHIASRFPNTGVE
ncbi:MAG: leucine-rich repeat protein [Erysipelotrichaceae bacterium]|nr:leucine-rich repeat protein [Erysipelotrichaceae bacterium]